MTNSTQLVVTKNILTNEVVDAIYDAIFEAKGFNGVSYTKDDVGELLSAIYDLNALDPEETMFRGTHVDDWKFPEATKLMIFGRVTLTGSDKTVTEVFWEDQTDYEKVGATKILKIAKMLYSSMKKEPKFTPITLEVRGRRALEDTLEYLVMNQDYVTSFFKDGNFPIVAARPTYQSLYLGTSLELSFESFLTKLIATFKE